MNTLVIYTLCLQVQYMTLVTPDKTYIYNPTPAAYIDVIKKSKSKLKVVQADLSDIKQGFCT